MTSISRLTTILLFTFYSFISLASLNFEDEKNSFKISPYAIRDDQRNLRVKFQLNEPAEITLSEIDASNTSNTLLDRQYDIQLVDLFIKNKPCSPARQFRFFVNTKSGLKTEKTLQVPVEICQESPLEKNKMNDENKILTPIIFGHVSDTQTRSSEHLKIAKVMMNLSNSIPFNFILNTGDIVDIGGKDSQWYDFFDTAKNYLLKIPMVAAIGNHDYYESRENDTPELFQKYLRWDNSQKEGFYSLSFNHFELLVFNSNLHKLSEKQKTNQWEWLEKRLKDNFNNRKISIVSMHYPVISSSLWTITDSSSREMKKIMIPLFEKYNVKLVLAGHTHLYERSFKNGVHYIIAGPAGGVPSVPSVKNPYMVFEKWGVSTFTMITVGHDIVVKTFNDDGLLIDEVEIPTTQLPVSFSNNTTANIKE